MKAEEAKRYIIWAQPLTRSCGTKVLYTLYERLRKRGFQAFIYCPGEHLSEYEYIDSLDAETLRRDVVVYPEIVYGNPLRFQNIARFVLYHPGALAGEEFYHPGEAVFSWARDYCNDVPLLSWNTVDTDLFFDEYLPKQQDCYFVNKHGKWKNIDEIKGATEINMHFPATQEELAQLLKTTRILYSFEDYSVLHDEAAFCGAQVKIITKEGLVDYTPYGLISEPDVTSMFEHFINQTQRLSYNGPLQEEEIFFPHYVGIFYKAAARCAVLGAWEETLNYCRKAFMGKPLEKTALARPSENSGKDNAYESGPAGNSFPPLLEEKGSIDFFLQAVEAGSYDKAEQAIQGLIARMLKQGNKPVLSAYLVLLALCYEQAGRDKDMEDAENLAIACNAANPLAVQMCVERCLAKGKTNQAVFFISRLINPYLTPLDIINIVPGMSLLGMVVAKNPDRLAAIAERLPALITSVSTGHLSVNKNTSTTRSFEEIMLTNPLGSKLRKLRVQDVNV